MATHGGKLAGRVAIVTGAGSGIGRATAHRLAAEGARVLVADLDRARADAVVAEIDAAGGEASAQTTDVAEEASVAAMVAAAVEKFGRLDILHNNAAASDPAIMGRDGEITALDTEVWDTTLAVNLRGPMLGCKHAIPLMLERPGDAGTPAGGVIINTTSASGLTGDLTRAAYGVSKAGLVALTQYVATQYGKRGIRCNAIAPGVISTPALEANVPREALDIYLRSHLTPRLGAPEDIAAAVAYLASDDAAYVTGQVLSVDGGLLAHHPAVGEFLRGGS